MDRDSNRARKAHSCRLESFTVVSKCRAEEDSIISFKLVYLKGITTPHEDPLVIQATITNYEVTRVFVDSGRSVNILFKEAFNRMQIDPFELQPLSIFLFGFAGHKIRPLEQVNLSLSLGEEPLRRTRSIVFIVVEVTSAYNVILVRPAMSTFKIVASTYHQKVKFPISSLVGEVQGNQVTSRKCYLEVIKFDQKRAIIESGV